MNKVEAWKSEKHGFDVWPDIEAHARASTPMSAIVDADLERMKWYGIFYRRRDEDGRYMLRTRVPGCELSAEQARGVAAVARRGHSIIDVTTRGNLQVQGLHVSDLPEAVEILSTVGLTTKQTGHDNVRNVMTHPWAGIDPAELIDVRGLCRRLTDVFLDDRAFADLPRKINVIVDGRPTPPPHCWTQDISFIAARRADGTIAFHWLLAGTQGQRPRLAWKPPVWVSEHDAPDVLRCALHVFREDGPREKRDKSRLRYLIESIGPDEFVRRVEERLGRRLDTNEEPVPEPRDQEDFVGWFAQKQPEHWALGVSVPLGRLTHEQLDGLADLAERFGDGSLRTAYDQGIVVPNIASSDRGAAVRALNRIGLEHEADSVARNLIACTGRQFCNIAVSETKGHAFGLMDALRAKGVRLAGIKINMSGCPSSCAQTHTADIGLKGVRVRRGKTTCDAFDVLLGGGVQGKVELARPYRKGVDLNQLPEVIAQVVRTYDNEHDCGQTFSEFWRGRLSAGHDPQALSSEEHRPEIWLCEQCGREIIGEGPPVFCPRCAALRKNFVRIEAADVVASALAANATEDEPQPKGPPQVAATIAPPGPMDAPRSDGHRDLCALSELERDGRRAVQLDGHELALFLVNGEARCVDAVCPHEGGPLIEGDVVDGVVVCPWHGWSFHCADGRSADGNACSLRAHSVKIEAGRVLVALKRPAAAEEGTAPALDGTAVGTVAARQDGPAIALRVIDVIDETPDTKTIRLDNSERRAPAHRAGQHVKVCVPGPMGPAWRSFTISSPPTRPEVLEITVKRNPKGTVSPAIHALKIGADLTIQGPRGRFIFDPELHKKPLVLVAAGSGVTPLMSILRTIYDLQLDVPVTMLYGCRTLQDVIYARELDALRPRLARLRLVLTLSRPGPDWRGPVGRVGPSLLARHVPELDKARHFLCGPGDLIVTLTDWLQIRGVAPDRIHSEQFGKSSRPRSSEWSPDHVRLPNQPARVEQGALAGV